MKFRLTRHWLELANQWLEEVIRQFLWLDSDCFSWELRKSYLPDVQGKSHIEVRACWNGPCLGHTGKRCAKRMLILQKGRATDDWTEWCCQAMRERWKWISRRALEWLAPAPAPPPLPRCPFLKEQEAMPPSLHRSPASLRGGSEGTLHPGPVDTGAR